jgi:hypothetical protein
MSVYESCCDGDEIVEGVIVFKIRLIVEILKFESNNIG